LRSPKPTLPADAWTTDIAFNQEAAHGLHPKLGFRMADSDNVETVADLHSRAQSELNSHQRLMERATSQVGRPRTIYLLCVAVVSWIVLNSVSRSPVDAPPFEWLQGVLALYAALMTTIVLATQNRQQRHAERHAYLDLQINLIAEQKTAKLIALLEELRRDMPAVPDRSDREAEEMARSIDATEVLSALEQKLKDEAVDKPQG
jgi:uncharacterized membrane protein